MISNAKCLVHWKPKEGAQVIRHQTPHQALCPVVGGTTGVVYFGSDVFLRHLNEYDKRDIMWTLMQISKMFSGTPSKKGTSKSLILDRDGETEEREDFISFYFSIALN